MIKRSRRARAMRLTVRPGGAVVVTAPAWSSSTVIERFVRQHAAWIERSVARMRDFKTLPVSGRRAYLAHRESARTFIAKRVAYWSAICEHPYRRIAIKNTKRVWGSCSRAGNLNFSYALLFLPRDLADYVIVHELCHLKEHNHGARFWALVGGMLPDFAARRRELRRYMPPH